MAHTERVVRNALTLLVPFLGIGLIIAASEASYTWLFPLKGSSSIFSPIQLEAAVVQDLTRDSSSTTFPAVTATASAVSKPPPAEISTLSSTERGRTADPSIRAERKNPQAGPNSSGVALPPIVRKKQGGGKMQPEEKKQYEEKQRGEAIKRAEIVINSDAARIYWFGLGSLYRSVCFGIIITCMVIMMTVNVRTHLERLFAVMLVLAVLVPSVLLTPLRILSLPPVVPMYRLLGPLMRLKVNMQSGDLTGRASKQPQMDLLDPLMAHVDVSVRLGFLTLLFLGLGVSATLIPRIQSANESDSERMGKSTLYLAHQMELQRYVLYAGTVFLVCSTLYSYSLYQWAISSSYPTTGSVYTDVGTLVKNVLIARGLLETLLLVGLYLPAACILKARATKYIPQLITDISASGSVTRWRTYEERSDWLKKQGLASEPIELVPRVVAILSPLLAGTVTQVLGTLAK